MKKLLLTLLMLVFGLFTWAQTGDYQVLMDQAQVFFEQKDYQKSTECYEQVIESMKAHGDDRLISTIKNSIAINHLYLGVSSLKNKDFIQAKLYLDNALKDAKPDSKTYYMAQSWMGQWYSVQALNIRVSQGDLQQAVALSLQAETCFNLAKAPDKCLKEQLSRASALKELAHVDEAETLLYTIIAECDNDNNRNTIKGKALFLLGGIEVDLERFQLAIEHLEQSYDLCLVDKTKNSQTYAYMAANKLSALYTNLIPDTEKAKLWKLRADELNE